MPTATLASAKYQRSMLATSSPRAIESEALARASAELKRAYEVRSQDYPAYVAALSRNLALWTLFAADAASDRNALPLKLRAGVVKIAAFVRAEALRVQRSQSETGIAALVEINANISAGLRQSRREGGVS